jgi:hypothetical protein
MDSGIIPALLLLLCAELQIKLMTPDGFSRWWAAALVATIGATQCSGESTCTPVVSS